MGNITRTGEKPKILVAPLDWGLGHATRCIPIIYELLRLNCEVIIATDGSQAKLLKDEFPDLRFVRLRGYKIWYAAGAWKNRVFIGLQIPKLWMRIRQENKWLNQFIAAEQPDAIISDNRFGLQTKHVPSIFITHQLHIKSGFVKWVDLILERMNHYYIRKFSACWIPDHEDPYSLAGELSSPFRIKGLPTVMVGPISRFKPCDKRQQDHLLILLSGPEPQRSILEKKLLGLSVSMAGSIIMVRGLPLETALPACPPNVMIHNHVCTEQLNKWICSAAFIICRSGYTTIMDLMILNKKSVLIPTPGQAEQEYLAERMHLKNWACRLLQEELSPENLENARAFSFEPFRHEKSNTLSLVLENLIQNIKEIRK